MRVPRLPDEWPDVHRLPVEEKMGPDGLLGDCDNDLDRSG